MFELCAIIGAALFRVEAHLVICFDFALKLLLVPCVRVDKDDVDEFVKFKESRSRLIAQ